MTNPLHLEETLQRDIDLLKSKVKQMASLSIGALKSSLQALVEHNRHLAYVVILRDQRIDELETELDRLCLEFLVRHQPAGTQLRFVYTTIQATKEIERIGDYAESIARQALVLSTLQNQPSFARFQELGDIAVQIVSDAARSFLEQDAALARKTMELEERANSLRNTINAEVAAWSDSGQIPPSAAGPLTTIARRLERTADQAKNFCEEVLYLCTGEFIKHKATEGFRVLFIDSANSSLSPMAEAIGNSLKLPRFTFSSAGITPQPRLPELVQFLARKGIDISNQTSKALQDLPRWESPQVVIVLDPKVKEHLPPRPNKTVTFTWKVDDPAEAQGTAETRQKAFEAAYEFLESNIRELTGALLEQPDTQLNHKL
ncbi:MAG TPA: phosphate signaling complex protein PhoU [Verrucomicrobiae bacterium]